MREETLKCLVHVVEKLDEKHLQEKLVRCIINLQNDTENSIRTNATIFLGRIAIKLKENVRIRVLCSSFSKSLKDNFLHCRIAGLKASVACLNLLDLSQLTTKIMPQVFSLLLDRSNEVRELALKFIDLSTKLMRENHENLCISEKNNAIANSNNNNESPMKNNNDKNVNDKDVSNWTSLWSSKGTGSGAGTGTGVESNMLTAIIESSNILGTKYIQSVTSSSTLSERISDNEIKDSRSNVIPLSSSVSSSASASILAISTDKNKIPVNSNIVQKLVMSDGWGDDNGFDDWGDNDSNSNGMNQNGREDNGNDDGGWGDDDLDFDVGGDDNNSPSTPLSNHQNYKNTKSNNNGNSNSNSNSGSNNSSTPNSPYKPSPAASTSTSTSISPSTVGQFIPPVKKSFQETKEKKILSSTIPKGLVSRKPGSSSGPSTKLAMTESGDNWDDF